MSAATLTVRVVDVDSRTEEWRGTLGAFLTDNEEAYAEWIEGLAS